MLVDSHHNMSHIIGKNTKNVLPKKIIMKGIKKINLIILFFKLEIQKKIKNFYVIFLFIYMLTWHF